MKLGESLSLSRLGHSQKGAIVNSFTRVYNKDYMESWLDNQAVGFGGEARRWSVETSVTHKRTAHDTPPTMEGPRKKQNCAYKNECHAGRACACVCVYVYTRDPCFPPYVFTF